MRYICLIASDESEMATWTPEDYQGILAAYAQFNRDAKAAGVYLSGEPLQPTSTATTVRVRNGETLASDGPFAETKEQLGGFYMLDCRDLDEALAWAARIPAAQNGSIEVRPIMELKLPE
jgi:hypothetical protein